LKSLDLYKSFTRLPEIAVSSAVRRVTVSRMARTSKTVVSNSDVIVSLMYTVYLYSIGQNPDAIIVEYCRRPTVQHLFQQQMSPGALQQMTDALATTKRLQ